MKLYIPMIILLALSVSCFESEVPTGPELSPVDAAVIANAHTVRQAAEAFFAANGQYPDWACNDFVALLPGGEKLVNPVTGEATEPGNCQTWGVGSVLYRVFAELDESGNRHVVGYYIVGRCEARDFVLTNIVDAADHIGREELLHDNCRLLAAAGKAYAEDNGGEYAPFENSTNAAGKTVIDYLPDAQRLVNPYTGERTEPSVWWHGEFPREEPTRMGQIAYLPYDVNGDGTWDGFALQGVGCNAPGLNYSYVKTPYEESEEYGESCQAGSQPCVQP